MPAERAASPAARADSNLNPSERQSAGRRLHLLLGLDVIEMRLPLRRGFWLDGDRER